MNCFPFSNFRLEKKNKKKNTINIKIKREGNISSKRIKSVVTKTITLFWTSQFISSSFLC